VGSLTTDRTTCHRQTFDDEVDGKWLVEHHVGSTLKRADRTPWVEYVASVGGLPEVADLWSRLRP
jgi:hypothetical protein